MLKFEFSPQDINVIAEALSNAPFKLAAPVLKKIQDQIDAAQVAHDANGRGDSDRPQSEPLRS
jgi:hypothetical protein